ncbi:MAG: transpeptidase family protein [Acidobacteriaceae bacterium]|nr:transpeptidase family protein [Acidobacteriaceae bacterium]
MNRVFTRPGTKRTDAAGAAPADWRSTLQRRVVVTACLLLTWAAGIEARLVYLQVVDRADLADRATRQQSQTFKPPAKRGDIVDRQGRVLATSVDAATIFVVPSAVTDERAWVTKICGALGDCTAKERADLIDRLQHQRNFAYIRRQVSDEVAERVKALNLDGIGFTKESRRYYPAKELASHVLGFVGLDNRGLAGIESAYDSQIRGKEGKVLVQTDAKRHAFSRSERPPTAGASIELSIDEYLQHVVERELHAGVVQNHALGGTALVMDPHTGEILAMANEPTFDPNAYRDSTQIERRNRAVQDLYEPGSTFKVVTASGAIEERLMPIDTMIDVRGGRIQIGPRIVRDTHDYGVLSFQDVIVKSSNVGAIKIGFKLGTDRLSDYVQRFGFGHPVSPDFPSESPGIVWDRAKWTDSALASVSMGYQVGVTPLQMVSAVSAVANGGEYVEPRVVRAEYRDNRRFQVKPKSLRRIIGADTAASMTGIMENVVEHGTGTLAKIAGYSVAGKTGTANKLVNGRYSLDTYASFVGFLPSRNPVVTILVVLDSPRGPNGHFGGPVSAPIFKRIAETTLRYLGVAPSINPAPPVLVRQEDTDSLPVVEALDTSHTESVEDVPGTVPSVIGLSAREATRKIVAAGLTARLSGNGYVIAQHPLPGEPIVEGLACELTLDRTPQRSSTAAP